MAATRLTFMFDFDNTLLDNDALKEHLALELRAMLGDAGASRFWEIYEDVRRERDVVDLPLTARRFAAESGDANQARAIEGMLDGIPFAQFVYPHVVDTLNHLKEFGFVGILSDGDDVFQPRKIERSGLAAAVDWHVLIYVHKEEHLDEVAARWPADHYVMVDDKAQILAALTQLLGPRVTTVHVLQGHYAREPLPPGFEADITVAAIGDLRFMTVDQFI